MTSSGLPREKHLITHHITNIQDDRYAQLMEPFSRCEMLLTNLRNRPLSVSSLVSMWDLILGLYHNLVTGQKDFPFILFNGRFCLKQLTKPFVPTEHGENATPSLLTDAPPGVMVPPAGSKISQLFTPVIPEKADLRALKADRRNYVRTVEIDGITVTRVISAVYCNEDTEMTNRWRITDYSAEGKILMSVLCQFLKMPAQGMRRKSRREESNSRSPTPPKKCLRM